MSRTTTILLGAGTVVLTAAVLRGHGGSATRSSRSLSALSQVSWTPQSEARARAALKTFEASAARQGKTPEEVRFSLTRTIATEAFDPSFSWPASAEEFQLEDVDGILTPRWVVEAGVNGAPMLAIWNHIEEMLRSETSRVREVG